MKVHTLIFLISLMCKDKTKKISDIQAELESIQNPVILGKGNELVKNFEVGYTLGIKIMLLILNIL